MRSLRRLEPFWVRAYSVCRKEARVAIRTPFPERGFHLPRDQERIVLVLDPPELVELQAREYASGEPMPVAG